MSHDPASNARRILPQNPQTGSFSFAPPTTYQQPQREVQKNYVFVDEHNRHKRLKVMRACEGCRRRKIKCDAATTNTWPCSACIRLKLHCVRPNGFEDNSTDDAQTYEQSPEQQYAAPQAPAVQMEAPLLTGAAKPGGAALYAPQATYHASAGLYQAGQYSEQQSLPHGDLQYGSVAAGAGVVDQPFASQPMFQTPPLQQASNTGSPDDPYRQDRFGQQDLTDLLGSLKVNEAGTAPYLNSKASRDREEEPAVEDVDDYKSVLPPLPSGPGLKVRIPPALMPDEETIRHYFELYFAMVHPYVPVLDKNMFWQQWHGNRESISPLLLEAVFAIAGRLADDPAQGQQWLALASKHADSFMDVPRLSTLQALMIILKARESAPKRGYYYRSWMSIVQCVQMGKDLGLDEHESDHAAGRPCDFPRPECLLRSRIWQAIFVCEVMIGSPQGRTDLAVEIDSVDFSVPRPMPGGDEGEYQVSRGFTYFARIVRNIGRLNQAYSRVKKTKDWGMDPELLTLGPSFEGWLDDIPHDLMVEFPADGSPPWLATAFIGNLHSYYYLSLILLHRPQLIFLQPSGIDGQWKHHMAICYNSAKMLCRLQEAVLQDFGLNGLQCMQRGVNFTIYSVLSSIVLHLVAITSPDPDLNSDAREYFTRHMRILEECMRAWPMPDMQRQIDAVREAFSADLRKPFVLKPSFPYGTPSSSSESPPMSGVGPKPPIPSTTGPVDRQFDALSQASYTTHSITPPISGVPPDLERDGSSSAQSMMMMAAAQTPQPVQSLPLTDPPAWNPTRIFTQWNTTFGTPQTVPVGSHGPLSATSSTSETTLQDIHATQAALGPDPQQAAQVPQVQQTSYQAAAPVHTFVTPAMWQESVASVYEGGLKRHWDFDVSTMPATKRR